MGTANRDLNTRRQCGIGCWPLNDYTCMCAKLLRLCPTLCNLIDYSLPGSSVHGILQARILEWVTISSSRASSQPRDQRSLFCLVLWQADSLPLVPPGKPPYRKSQGLSSHICKMGLYYPVAHLCPQSYPRTTC